jgi:hypothetical protein
MRKAGVPESVIMRITGHSKREIFDRYNKVDEDDSRGAVERMRLFAKNELVRPAQSTIPGESAPELST